MGRQITRPRKIYEAVKARLENPVHYKYPDGKPAWFDVVQRIPPTETVIRPLAVQLQPHNPKQKKPKNLYLPQKIIFPEDELRRTFYQHHPWELARPRVIIETDGKDYRRYDWSKGLRQPGMPLCGES